MIIITKREKDEKWMFVSHAYFERDRGGFPLRAVEVFTAKNITSATDFGEHESNCVLRKLRKTKMAEEYVVPVY